ncbi:glycoside hydrolase family 13 protein [Romboutsia sp. 13368]|uniref:glycoside hydrolase family 13 protein n=1 Tax=Romboutsia sp. 13368 TaxID=2708053 RepID=UPI0025E84B26|nr:glycoside hydrolase family 13 protein [Romboutsia sp. 13368]
MRNVIHYNSWENKAPFGAIKVNQGVRIAVRTNEEYDVLNIKWVILKEDNVVGHIDLVEENRNYYQGEFNGFNETGLYFYYFEVDVNINGSYQKIFYGKSFEDGHTIEYSYENLNKYQITVHEDFEVPSWYKEGIMYNIFVDRFNNGNRNKKPSNPKPNSFIYGNWSDIPMYIKDKDGEIIRWDFYGGNLKGIIEKLPYLSKIGVTIIYLNPIFESSSNHKYNTGDYKKIDPMFGDEEILKELIDKASKRGINIILDGVFNHTGADSKYFNKFGNYDEVGAYQSEDSKYRPWYNFEGSKDNYKCWWGIKDLPNVNELNESYMDYIIYDVDSVINKWTGMGIKGWRLDVADELPTKFIKELRKELKNNDSDSVLIGEVWEDASNKISYGERRNYFVGDQLDSVMAYPFRNNIVSFLKGQITSNQLRNKFMTLKENYPKESFKSNLNIISSHDITRIKTELNYDNEMVKLAVATQMTFEGIPYIYYGDEAGLSGGTDPDNRRTYPWKNEDEDMIEFYKDSINTRKKYNALTNGDTDFIINNDDDIFGYIRFNDNGEKILVLINRSTEDKNINISLEENTLEVIDIKYSSKKYLEIISKNNDSFNLQIRPKSFNIFNVLNLVEV